MGLLFKKRTRAALDRKKVIVSYFVLSACILLIAVNVGCFLHYPRETGPLALILSNAITLILAIAAFRPVNALIENLLEKRQQQLQEEQARELALEQKVDQLEKRAANAGSEKILEKVAPSP